LSIDTIHIMDVANVLGWSIYMGTLSTNYALSQKMVAINTQEIKEFTSQLRITNDVIGHHIHSGSLKTNKF